MPLETMNSLFDRPNTFGGMWVTIATAQQQRRTARDIPGPWVRPRVPNKRIGRKGTRRMWKRSHPPHRVMLYREPTDVLVVGGSTIIATPFQADALRKTTRVTAT